MPPAPTAAADVVVIGAGIIGTSCAYFLARDGHRVTLVERGDVASGTASASGGWVIVQGKEDERALRFAVESRRLYDLVAEDAGVQVLATGGLIVASTPAELDRLRAQHRRAGALLLLKLLGPQEIRDLEPALVGDLAGALHCTDDAIVDPPQVCRALAARAGDLGATIVEHEPVTGIEQDGNRVSAVRTSQRRIPAGAVVCAAGVWSAEVGRMMDVHVPVQPRRGHLLTIAERLVSHPVLETGYLEVTGPQEQDRGVQFVMQPRVEGGCLVGSSREFKGFDRTVDRTLVDTVWSRASRYVPALARMRVEHVVVGLRPFCRLGRPVIGRAGPEGFVVAAGHEGEGITLGPATGKLVADVLAGRVDRTGYELEA